MKSRTECLEKLIVKHQELYYNGVPEISDAEFDCLWDELKSLDPENALFDFVGEDNSSDFKKVKHLSTMGSQNKANSIEEVLKWAKQFDPEEEVLLQRKMDGCSISLVYENGEYMQAVSRGNGYIGDDITSNASKMDGCTKKLSDLYGKPFSGSVRGEVMLPRSLKKKHYPEMANCRNAASGIMKRLDGKGSELLRIVTYDVCPNGINLNEKEKLDFLSENFIAIPKVVCRVKDLEELAPIELERMDILRKEESFEYDLDGMVIKQAHSNAEDLKSSHPKTQIAFKFPREEVLTTLEGIEWSLNNGTYTPIGLISAVQLCGTTVRKASLCNLRMIEEEGFHAGATVVVTKRGEIIPKIERVVEGAYVVPLPPTPPTECVACGGKVVTNSDKTKTYCSNEDCSSKKIGKINKWVNTLSIKELAPVTISKFLENKIIDGTIASLYEIDWSVVSALEGFGEKSAQLIKKNLLNVKEVFLEDFVAGFNIPNIGSKVVEKIINSTGAKDVEALLRLSTEDCICEGVGYETASKFTSGIQREKEDLIRTLSYVTLKDVEEGDLAGLSVCFTGSLETMKRAQAEDLVKQHSGTVCKDVIKGLSILVTNDPNSGSSKNKKAVAQGTRIITEKEFLELIGEV